MLTNHGIKGFLVELLTQFSESIGYYKNFKVINSQSPEAAEERSRKGVLGWFGESYTVQPFESP